MPKLNQKTAKEVAAAGTPDDFTPIPESRYLCQLNKVTALPPAAGGSGFPQWEIDLTVQYDVDNDDDETHKGRTLKDWLSLSDKKYPRQKLNEFFGAFGVPITTDTEDMLGSEVVCVVSIGVAGVQSKRAGQKLNNIDAYLPADFDAADDGEGTPGDGQPTKAAVETDSGEESF